MSGDYTYADEVEWSGPNSSPLSIQIGPSDSIWLGALTQGPRPPLIDAINARGWLVTTKGTQSGDQAGTRTDLLHECHDGWASDTFGTDVYNQIADICIIAVGANDVGNARSAAAFIASVRTLRDRAKTKSGHVAIFSLYTGDWTAPQIALSNQYDPLLDDLIDSKTSVDHTIRNGFNIATMLLPADVTHPNATGNTWLKDCALAHLIAHAGL